jgi:hypothetical protein
MECNLDAVFLPKVKVAISTQHRTALRLGSLSLPVKDQVLNAVCCSPAVLGRKRMFLGGCGFGCVLFRF